MNRLSCLKADSIKGSVLNESIERQPCKDVDKYHKGQDKVKNFKGIHKIMNLCFLRTLGGILISDIKLVQGESGGGGRSSKGIKSKPKPRAVQNTERRPTNICGHSALMSLTDKTKR